MNMDEEMNQKIESTLDKLYENRDQTIMVGELYDEPIFYNNAVRTLDNILYEENLITIDNEARRLTSKGLKICASGGWIKYLENQEQAKQKQTDLDQLQMQSLKSSININKWNKVFLIINVGLVLINIVLMILVAKGIFTT